jgi:hypothetical protein
MIKNIAHFVKEEIWLISEQDLGVTQAWAVKCLKIVLHSFI